MGVIVRNPQSDPQNTPIMGEHRRAPVVIPCPYIPEFLEFFQSQTNVGDLAIGAQERTRTFTAVKPLAPEASASTNSATWAQFASADR